ncbi:MAG TPA: TolC family protein [Thermoanaerobaculia bacterium]|nr:TolC family protein [Thermoanaerobaculia bacterium]
MLRRLFTIPLMMTATLLSAQTAQVPTANPTVQRTTAPVTAETDQDVNNPRALRLSLGDAIRATAENNLGIQLQYYDYRMSGELLTEQYGYYDWLVTGRAAIASDVRASASTFNAGATRTTILNAGIAQNIPTGGNYSFSFNNARTSTSTFGTTINPSYGSDFGFNFNQPLLRNFGVDVTNRGILIARNTLGINRELFRTVLINTASSVEQAYLDLIYARQFVDVVRESVFLARDQSRITQIRIDVGASAPLDILQPRVQIATSEESLIVAVADVRSAEDRLRALMNLPPGDWDRPILPTDTVGYTPIAINMEQAVTRAYDLRPEVRENLLTTETRRIQYLFARNQVLPRLDLDVAYGAAGVAGTALATDPFTGQPTNLSSTNYPHAINQILRGDFPSWTVGVNLGLPLLNIGARAEKRRAQLDLERSETQQAQTRQSIAVEVRTAVRAIDTSAKEITASRTAREAAEQNLEAERKRYENGMTTNFQVLQIQQQLSDARARELQALVGYNKAVAEYHRAVGDLLDVRSISIDEPKVEEPRIFPIDLGRYNWLNYGSHARAEVQGEGTPK